MFKKKEKLQGKFIASESSEVLAEAQKKRLPLLIAALVFGIVPHCINIEALSALFELNLISIVGAYLIFVFVFAVIFITTFVFSFTRYKIRAEVPARFAPKNGFEEHTWSFLEWSFYLYVIYAIIYLAATIYRFGACGAIAFVFSAAGAICMYFAVDITKKAMCKKMRFEGTFEKLSGASAPAADDESGSCASDGEASEESETDDFYDER